VRGGSKGGGGRRLSHSFLPRVAFECREGKAAASSAPVPQLPKSARERRGGWRETPQEGAGALGCSVCAAAHELCHPGEEEELQVFFHRMFQYKLSAPEHSNKNTSELNSKTSNF